VASQYWSQFGIATNAWMVVSFGFVCAIRRGSEGLFVALLRTLARCGNGFFHIAGRGLLLLFCNKVGSSNIERFTGMFGGGSVDARAFTRGNNAIPDVEQIIAGDCGLRLSVDIEPGARSA
jgi:hypothetical protein